MTSARKMPTILTIECKSDGKSRSQIVTTPVNASGTSQRIANRRNREVDSFTLRIAVAKRQTHKEPDTQGDCGGGAQLDDQRPRVIMGEARIDEDNGAEMIAEYGDERHDDEQEYRNERPHRWGPIEAAYASRNTVASPTWRKRPGVHVRIRICACSPAWASSAPRPSRRAGSE
jgi:hypothetical protein